MSKPLHAVLPDNVNDSNVQFYSIYYTFIPIKTNFHTPGFSSIYQLFQSFFYRGMWKGGGGRCTYIRNIFYVGPAYSLLLTISFSLFVNFFSHFQRHPLNTLLHSIILGRHIPLSESVTGDPASRLFTKWSFSGFISRCPSSIDSSGGIVLQ